MKTGDISFWLVEFILIIIGSYFLLETPSKIRLFIISLILVTINMILISKIQYSKDYNLIKLQYKRKINNLNNIKTN